MLDRRGFLEDDAWGDGDDNDAPSDPVTFPGDSEAAAPAAGGAPNGDTAGTTGGGDEVIEVDTTYDDLATAQVDAIREGIDAIQENVKKIRQLKNKASEEVDSNLIKDMITEVDQLTHSSINLATANRDKVDALRKSNAEYAGHKQEEGEEHSTKVMWRKNQLRTVSKLLKAATGDVTAASADFQRTIQKRQVRQACIISDLDEDQKEEMIRRAEQNPFAMQQEIMAGIERFNVSKATVDRIADLEEQNQQMKNIEASVKRIQEMFEQMAQMVVEQGEMLDEIEANVEVTRDHVAKAKKQIFTAAEHKKSARKKQVCWMICCVAILVILIMSVAGVF